MLKVLICASPLNSVGKLTYTLAYQRLLLLLFFFFGGGLHGGARGTVLMMAYKQESNNDGRSVITVYC